MRLQAQVLSLGLRVGLERLGPDTYVWISGFRVLGFRVLVFWCFLDFRVFSCLGFGLFLFDSSASARFS